MPPFLRTCHDLSAARGIEHEVDIMDGLLERGQRFLDLENVRTAERMDPYRLHRGQFPHSSTYWLTAFIISSG
jgi:hypothetical protein